MGVVALIVMEPGSDWPGHVGNSDNVVAAGAGDEPLLPRTRFLAEALRQRCENLRVAVLACNGATDARSADRRADVARELMRAVAPVTLGRLVLSTGSGATAALREQLLALADTLRHEMPASKVTVSLRFGGSDAPRTDPLPEAEPWDVLHARRSEGRR